MQWVEPDQIQKILSVPHFKDSHYAKWNINRLLGTHIVCFVDQIMKYDKAAKIDTIVDVGTGYGWLAIACALRTAAKIIAIDVNPERLAAAIEISAVFGVSERIDWRVGSIGELPLDNQQADVTFCIEVIEHVGLDCRFVYDLGRITKDFLVITTPNQIFPVIGHDTSLPFCHWLPLRARDYYAALFGRRSMQDNNLFWSPSRLLSALNDFERKSDFLQFPTYSDFVSAENLLDPDSSETGAKLRRAKNAYYRLASLAGRNSIYVLPNLASTFRRRMKPAYPGRASDTRVSQRL